MTSDAGGEWDFIQELNRYEDVDDLMVFFGGWGIRKEPEFSVGKLHASNNAGDLVYFEFVGNEITWVGTRGPDHGLANVYLDGEFHSVVDLYDPVEQALVNVGTLTTTSGIHTLRIEVLGQNNPASTGQIVTVDAFDVLNETPESNATGFMAMTTAPTSALQSLLQQQTLNNNKNVSRNKVEDLRTVIESDNDSGRQKCGSDSESGRRLPATRLRSRNPLHKDRTT